MDVGSTSNLVRTSQLLDQGKGKEETFVSPMAEIRDKLVSYWDGKSLSSFKVVGLSKEHQLPLVQFLPLHYDNRKALQFSVEKFSEITSEQKELQRVNQKELVLLENESTNQKLEFEDVRYTLEMELKKLTNPFLKKTIAESLKTLQGLIDISAPDSLLLGFSHREMPQETISSIDSFITLFCRKAYESYNIDRFVNDFKLKMKNFSEELLANANEEIEAYRKTWPVLATFLSLPPITALNNELCRLIIEYAHLCNNKDQFEKVVNDLIKIEIINSYLKGDSAVSLLHQVIHNRPCSYSFPGVIEKPAQLIGKTISLFDTSQDDCIISSTIISVKPRDAAESVKDEHHVILNLQLDNQLEVLIDSNYAVKIRKVNSYNFWLAIRYNTLRTGDIISIPSQELISAGLYKIEEIKTEKKFSKKQYTYFAVTISNMQTWNACILSCYINDTTEAISRPTVEVKLITNRSHRYHDIPDFGEYFIVKKEFFQILHGITKSNINQKILVRNESDNFVANKKILVETGKNQISEIVKALKDFTSCDELTNDLQNIFATLQTLMNIRRKREDGHGDYILCIGGDKQEGNVLDWLAQTNVKDHSTGAQIFIQTHGHEAHSLSPNVSLSYYPMWLNNSSIGADHPYNRLINDYSFDQTTRNSKQLLAVVILFPLREFIFHDHQSAMIYFLADIKNRFPWLLNEKNTEKIFYLLRGEGNMTCTLEKQIIDRVVEILDPQPKSEDNPTKSEFLSRIVKYPPIPNNIAVIDFEDNELRDELVKKYTERSLLNIINDYEPPDAFSNKLIDFLIGTINIAISLFKGYRAKVKKNELVETLRKEVKSIKVSLVDNFSQAYDTQNTVTSEPQDALTSYPTKNIGMKKKEKGNNSNLIQEIGNVLKLTKNYLDGLALIAKAACQDYSKNEKSKELLKMLAELNKMKITN